MGRFSSQAMTATAQGEAAGKGDHLKASIFDISTSLH